MVDLYMVSPTVQTVLDATGAITFSAHGIPRPQPRPRFVPGRPVPVSTMDPAVRAWRARVTEAVARAMDGRQPFKGPCAVACRFRLPTVNAQHWHQAHIVRPDADNLLKLVLDCMSEGGAWSDDKLVAKAMAEKLWSPRAMAGVDVVVWPVGPAATPAASGGLGIAPVGGEAPDWLK